MMKTMTNILGISDFNPTKTGRKTFTVIAQGDNSKEEDSYDFTVTIT